MRDRYFDANTPKVAVVVCFYMSAALVVSDMHTIYSLTPNERTDGVCVRCSSKSAGNVNPTSDPGIKLSLMVHQTCRYSFCYCSYSSQ